MSVELSGSYVPGIGRPVRAEGRLSVGYRLTMRESQRQALYRQAHQAGYHEAAQFIRQLLSEATS